MNKILEAGGAIEIKMPPRYCVYFLENAGEIIYIGKSEGRLLGRIGAHAYRKTFDKIYFIDCKSEKEMTEKEMVFIIKLQPRENAKIDNPEKIGYANVSEIKVAYKNKFGRGDWRKICKLMAGKNIKSIQVNGCVYYERKVLDLIKS